MFCMFFGGKLFGAQTPRLLGLSSTSPATCPLVTFLRCRSTEQMRARKDHGHPSCTPQTRRFLELCPDAPTPQPPPWARLWRSSRRRTARPRAAWPSATSDLASLPSTVSGQAAFSGCLSVSSGRTGTGRRTGAWALQEGTPPPSISSLFFACFSRI